MTGGGGREGCSSQCKCTRMIYRIKTTIKISIFNAVSMIIELIYYYIVNDYRVNILLCLSGNKSALNNIIVFDDKESHTN